MYEIKKWKDEDESIDIPFFGFMYSAQSSTLHLVWIVFPGSLPHIHNTHRLLITQAVKLG